MANGPISHPLSGTIEAASRSGERRGGACSFPLKGRYHEKRWSLADGRTPARRHGRRPTAPTAPAPWALAACACTCWPAAAAAMRPSWKTPSRVRACLWTAVSASAISLPAATRRFDPAKLAAILVTHDHTDHTKGVGVVLRGLAKQGVEPTVYVDDAVRAASKEIESVEDACDLRALPIGGMLSVAGMAVHVFGTSHDAASSCGFRFEGGDDAVGFDDRHR